MPDSPLLVYSFVLVQREHNLILKYSQITEVLILHGERTRQ